jgi:peptide/nickel transport system permease protein
MPALDRPADPDGFVDRDLDADLSGRDLLIIFQCCSTGFPLRQRGDCVADPAGDPLGLFELTLIMRLVRSEMLEVMRTDYIRFARARGLKDSTVYFGHALKSTLVPVVTVMGLQLGTMIAFSIVTETVFQWPGLGLLFVQAIGDVDIPVMAAYLMLTGLMFCCINFVVDVLYWMVDRDCGRRAASERT